jgi:uncharacterized protein (TIGR03083 family)
VTSLAGYVTALDATWHGTLDAVTGLSASQWDLPTDCPGWTVKDNVSHLVGVERLLLPEPQPQHVLPDSLPHVRNDFGRFMEVHVDLRRSVPGDTVASEFRDVVGRRLSALRALPPAAIDDEFPGVTGAPRKLAHILAIRVFDCWTHEQDIRRALGRPGGLASPAALLSLQRLLLAWTSLADDVPAATGATVAVVTTGAVESAATLRLGSPPSVTDGDAPGRGRTDCGGL